MLLQNTLDLSTFEIVRFRIWNQTSQPSDRGFGSKYFNTNSGHEAYCREEIFTPIGWRTAAYMDDIDKINEKLDLIFGDELDTDTIIDSWKEVQDFLAGIEDTKTLMTMLDGKAEWNKNISSDSFKAIGYGTTGANGWKFNGPALSFGANSTYYAQLQINFQADQVVFRRHTPEGFTEWQTLLHSGIVGDYTAGAAKKLADDAAHTAWGQTFFENGKPKSIQGGLSNVTYIRFLDGGTNGIYRGLSFASNQTATDISYVATGHYFYINGASAMTITEEGNVLIGRQANNLDAIIETKGLVHIEGGSTNTALGSAPVHGLTIGYDTIGGLAQWIHETNFSGNIQAMNLAGTATAYALNLNPFGGAVNIASAGNTTNILGSATIGNKDESLVISL